MKDYETHLFSEERPVSASGLFTRAMGKQKSCLPSVTMKT